MEKDIPGFFREQFFALEFFSAPLRKFASGAAVLAGLIVLGVSLQSEPKAPAFAEAEAVFAKWAKSSSADTSLFDEMTAALRKVPPLQVKYESVIAQKLIEGGNSSAALEIGYRAIERSRSETPYHAFFAETTLLIEQECFQNALEHAASLKAQMDKECNVSAFSQEPLVGGSLLYAHNLLRLACLQQELSNSPGELAAWEELEAFLSKAQGTKLSQLFLSCFQEKQVSLPDYIAERKSRL